MGVVLINPFTVFTGREEAFLALWDQTAARLATYDGFGGARLVAALDPTEQGGQAPPFTHVAIADWASAAAYAVAIADPEIRKLAPDYAQVSTFQPALYRPIRPLEIAP